MARHDRRFWAALVAECAAGSRNDETAERYGVAPRTLAWWRWKLGADAKAESGRKRARRRRRREPVQLLPVEVAIPDSAPTPSHVELLVGAAVLRFEVGTDPQYIAALVRGIAP
jgi:hypothetical protein